VRRLAVCLAVAPSTHGYPSRLLNAPVLAGRIDSHLVGKNPDLRKARKPAYRKQEIRSSWPKAVTMNR